MQERLCVVFGGTGFIGQQTICALGRSSRLRIVSRSKRRSTSPQIAYVQAQLANTARLKQCIAGAHVVYHLATGGGTVWADFERDYIQGTRAIAEACLDFGVPRLVYVSSISALYLGSGRKVNEHSGTDCYPSKRSYYSRVKILAEQMLLRLYHERDLPVVIVRPGLVVGRGGLQAHGGLGYWPSDLHCLSWGRRLYPMPFVLASDVASALVACGSVPGIEGLTFNLVGDVRPTAKEFIEQLAHRSNRLFKYHPRSLPSAYAASLGRWILKRIAGRKGLEMPAYRDLQSRTFKSIIDCTAAKQLLGWQPVNDREAFFSEAIDSQFLPDSQAG